MIIFGWRGLTSTIESHDFECPQCGELSSGDLKQVRKWFTLYFIPVIPLGVEGHFVECSECQGTYDEQILDYDPEKEREETELALLRIMIMAAKADGLIDANEIEEIKVQYQDFTGLPVPEEKLQREIQLAEKSNASLSRFVSNVASKFSNQGKALAVKLAYQTMTASGDMEPGHKAELKKMGVALEIPDAQYAELLKQVRKVVEEE